MQERVVCDCVAAAHGQTGVSRVCGSCGVQLGAEGCACCMTPLGPSVCGHHRRLQGPSVEFSTFIGRSGWGVGTHVWWLRGLQRGCTCLLVPPDSRLYAQWGVLCRASGGSGPAARPAQLREQAGRAAEGELVADPPPGMLLGRAMACSICLRLAAPESQVSTCRSVCQPGRQPLMGHREMCMNATAPWPWQSTKSWTGCGPNFRTCPLPVPQRAAAVFAARMRDVVCGVQHCCFFAGAKWFALSARPTAPGFERQHQGSRAAPLF
jgi:hypothetical protein